MNTNLTVKELREKLANFPDDMEVVFACAPSGNYCNFTARPDADCITTDSFAIEEYNNGTTSFVTKERVIIGCDEV